ncbi:MAG: nucleotidyltransferase domain-containing protein, partial [Acidobacteriota bacterium]
HAHIQMARELGMNPRKFGSLDNQRQERWKAPLPDFIESLYFDRFNKDNPDSVVSIEEIAKTRLGKKEQKRHARIEVADAGKPTTGANAQRVAQVQPVGAAINLPSAFLEALRRWGADDGHIDAIGIVGSYATGTATEGSDVDVVALTSKPKALLSRKGWSARFGEVLAIETEEWGAITSLRVWYQNGLEVEFGIGRPSWASVPPDEGTAQVVRDGLKIIYDPGHLLSRLSKHVTGAA